MAQSAEKSFQLIQSAFERNRLAHAFLISGALGSGKEAMASKLVGLVNGESNNGDDLFGEPVTPKEIPLDDREGGWVRVIRPRSKSRKISVKEIRDLEHTLQLAAPQGETKIGVIVDADCMNEQAENAFLKTLEEPPENTLLLLLSSRPQRLLPTILSRCVQVKLTGGRPIAAAGGEELVTQLLAATGSHFKSPVVALRLKAIFSQFLLERKTAAEAAGKAALKEEIATYRDATDGVWLKEREDFHKAGAEADYLEARNQLLDVIRAWFADLLRLKVGAEGFEFPEMIHKSSSLIAHETLFSLSRRLEAIDTLRRTLETNASEPLALEVGFLRAFS